MHFSIVLRPLMSLSSPSLRRYLYVSELAPAMPSNVVGQILRQSRERNQRLNLTGALLFDGEHFCQLLEGEPDTAQALMGRIASDPRHHGLKMLLDALSPVSRRMTQWLSGYSNHDAFDAIVNAAAIDPASALDAFMQVLKTSEVST